MKLTATRSPKLKRLMRLTGMRRVEAVGTLELLWLFTMEQAPSADVGRWRTVDLETELEWEGEPGALEDALVEAGWLDRCAERRLVIHDWADHAPEFLKKRIDRGTLTVYEAVPCPDNGGHRPTTSPDGGQRPVREGKGREGKGSLGDTYVESADDDRPSLALVPTNSPAIDIEAEVFAEVCRVAAEYRGTEPAWILTPKRRARMRAIAKQFGPRAPVDAVHGYAAKHLVGGTWEDRWKYFQPDSIWRAANVTAYLEADKEARAAGRERPYTEQKKMPRWLEQTRRIAAREGLKL